MSDTPTPADLVATVHEALDALGGFTALMSEGDYEYDALQVGTVALHELAARVVTAERARDEAQRRLRDAPIGGDGSHWVDCHLSHIDCSNAKLAAAVRERDNLRDALRAIAENAETYRYREIGSLERIAEKALSTLRCPACGMDHNSGAIHTGTLCAGPAAAVTAEPPADGKVDCRCDGNPSGACSYPDCQMEPPTTEELLGLPQPATPPDEEEK